MKVAAVVLGPTGVGLVGLYTNLMSTAAAISSLGVGTTAVRQVVAAGSDGGESAVSRTRRALFWGTLALAAAGAAVVWLSRGWIARVFLSDENRSGDVAWLALGVALTVAAASQTALLTGLRRIGDLARVNIASALFGALAGILVLHWWPAQGVLVLVLVGPALSFLVGRIYIIRLNRPLGPRPSLSALAREWATMARPGVPFMLAGLISLLGQLAVRTLVQRELGLDALGQFQAAWSISVIYLGFVLGAMATDYVPRLSAAVKDRALSVRLINEQTEVALLLCAPIVLAMLAFTPWVIRLLYSAEFAPAVEILRWQLLGDILKVVIWPLGFMCQAWGAGKVFLMTEVFGAIFLVLAVFIGLPHFGLAATGIAFLAMYLAYLPLMLWLGHRWVGFRWTQSVRIQIVGIFASATLLDVTSRQSDLWGSVLGGALVVGMALWAVIRLSSLAEAGGRLGRIGELGKKAAGWVIRRK